MCLPIQKLLETCHCEAFMEVSLPAWWITSLATGDGTPSAAPLSPQSPVGRAESSKSLITWLGFLVTNPILKLSRHPPPPAPWVILLAPRFFFSSVLGVLCQEPGTKTKYFFFYYATTVNYEHNPKLIFKHASQWMQAPSICLFSWRDSSHISTKKPLFKTFLASP